MDAYKKIITDGLWTNNQALVALLGLCPLLAVTNNLTNGLGLGIATLAVLLTSNILVSLIRDYVPSEIRIPVFISIIASAVTAIELLMNAYLHDLYKVLGIFIPLIVTNCAILARADAFASKNTVDKAMVDALAVGIGFALVLVILGGIRDLIGQGTLFDQMHLLFGESARAWTLHIYPSEWPGFLLALLPPGAFIALGLMLAVMNVINARKKAKLASIPVELKAKAEA